MKDLSIKKRSAKEFGILIRQNGKMEWADWQGNKMVFKSVEDGDLLAIGEKGTGVYDLYKYDGGRKKKIKQVDGGLFGLKKEVKKQGIDLSRVRYIGKAGEFAEGGREQVGGVNKARRSRVGNKVKKVFKYKDVVIDLKPDGKRSFYVKDEGITSLIIQNTKTYYFNNKEKSELLNNGKIMGMYVDGVFKSEGKYYVIYQERGGEYNYMIGTFEINGFLENKGSYYDEISFKQRPIDVQKLMVIKFDKTIPNNVVMIGLLSSNSKTKDIEVSINWYIHAYELYVDKFRKEPTHIRKFIDLGMDPDIVAMYEKRLGFQRFTVGRYRSKPALIGI